jgi:hypothetical protein
MFKVKLFDVAANYGPNLQLRGLVARIEIVR